MPLSKFLFSLLATIILSLIAYYIFEVISKTDAYFDLSYYSIILFTLISLVFYLIGTKATKSENKYLFIHIIVYNIIVKMVFSVLLVFVYVKLLEPSNKMFIVPFILVYLIFTIFETYFLSVLSRLNK